MTRNTKYLDLKNSVSQTPRTPSLPWLLFPLWGGLSRPPAGHPTAWGAPCSSPPSPSSSPPLRLPFLLRTAPVTLVPQSKASNLLHHPPNVWPWPLKIVRFGVGGRGELLRPLQPLLSWKAARHNTLVSSSFEWWNLFSGICTRNPLFTGQGGTCPVARGALPHHKGTVLPRLKLQPASSGAKRCRGTSAPPLSL